MGKEILLQAFYWEMCTDSYKKNFKEECNLWNLLAKRAASLAESGFTAVWIPPATKGNAGDKDTGYGIYDLWDLGEFEQKGSKRTKYGTKEELIKALDKLHSHGIKVYFDAVLNHRFGADQTETVQLKDGTEAEVWTQFDFPGRNGKYSQYKPDWSSFDGVDWDERTKKLGKILFSDKDWDWSYGEDFLMGADLDYNNKEVQRDVLNWGKWIINDLGFDGFRIDAAKHIDQGFLRTFIKKVNESSSKEVFFGGEAWIEEEDVLIDFIKQIDAEPLKVFDYPLRSKFVEMKHRNLDMRSLKNAGLVNNKNYQDRVVTFVDTHDTDRDQIDDDNIESISHYKYHAYAYILLRDKGLPTIYWKDYYTREMSEKLDLLINTRQKYAFGRGVESSATDQATYCYLREDENQDTELVMLLTIDDSNDIINKEIQTQSPHTEYFDITGHIEQSVKTDQEGIGCFSVIASEDRGWSVWVKKVIS